MNCPRCKTTALLPVAFDGVSAERCPSCQGTWLPRSAFKSAVEHEDAEAGWLAFELWRDAARFRGLAGDLACPRCRKTMVRLAYGDVDVLLDVCPDCQAVWLDARELERTVHALGKELARMPVKQILGAAFEEAGLILRSKGSLADEWRHMARVARLLEQRVLADHPGLRRLLVSLQGGGGFP
jgi:Zn-finger nucleic acid-binding protein